MYPTNMNRMFDNSISKYKLFQLFFSNKIKILLFKIKFKLIDSKMKANRY